MGLFAVCALFLTFIAFPMMMMVSFLITSRDIGVQYVIKYFEDHLLLPKPKGHE